MTKDVTVFFGTHYALTPKAPPQVITHSNPLRLWGLNKKMNIIKEIKFKKKFTNYNVVYFFLKNGYLVEQPVGGFQYRISGVVDIYSRSLKIFSVKKQIWIETTADTIIELVINEIKGLPEKSNKYKLHNMSFTEWQHLKK